MKRKPIRLSRIAEVASDAPCVAVEYQVRLQIQRTRHRVAGLGDSVCHVEHSEGDHHQIIVQRSSNIQHNAGAVGRGVVITRTQRHTVQRYADAVSDIRQSRAVGIRTGEGGLAEALRPVRIQKGEIKAIDEELRRLDIGLLPPKRDMGLGVPITSEQYNSWIMMANTMDASGNMPGDPGYSRGETLLEQLNELIGSEDYKNASAQKQEDKIRRVYNGMYNRAKKMLAEELYISEPSFRKRLEAEDPELARRMGERIGAR